MPKSKAGPSKALVLAGLCVASMVLAYSTVGAKDTAGANKPKPEATLTASVDRHIESIWKRDGVKPARATTDEEFIRRVYFETVGTPPTPEVVRAFLADKSATKRAAMIDQLVDDSRFGAHVADLWLNVLGRRGKANQNTDLVLGAWLAEGINNGTGFEKLIYEMISATGTMADNPAAAYYSSTSSVIIADIAGEATRHFTGVQIQCAQCHDHPYEAKWRVADFHGVAAFFWPMRMNRNGDAQPRLANIYDQPGKPIPFKELEAKINQSSPDDLRTLLRSERWQAPKFLGGPEAGIQDARQWRKGYAGWVSSDENLQTQRYLANRFWSFMFGSGLMNPVDDFNSFNEASHPELLDLLATDLRENGSDVKRFYRAVLKSRTWQLSSTPAKDAEVWHFANYPVRQLTPEQFFASLLQIQSASGQRKIRAAGNDYSTLRKKAEGVDKRVRPGRTEYDLESIKKLDELLSGANADWLEWRGAARGFAAVSDDDEMTESDTLTLTIDKALMLMNGEETNHLADWSRGSVLDSIVKGSTTNSARIEELYLRVLARKPQPAEVARLEKYLKEHSSSQAAWEDIMFSLLMSAEFTSNY